MAQTSWIPKEISFNTLHLWHRKSGDIQPKKSHFHTFLVKHPWVSLVYFCAMSTIYLFASRSRPGRVRDGHLEDQRHCQERRPQQAATTGAEPGLRSATPGPTAGTKDARLRMSKILVVTIKLSLNSDPDFQRGKFPIFETPNGPLGSNSPKRLDADPTTKQKRESHVAINVT